MAELAVKNFSSALCVLPEFGRTSVEDKLSLEGSCSRVPVHMF